MERVGRRVDIMASSLSTSADVIVVGAGPAGTAAALLLALQDFRVILLDSAKFPRRKTYAGWLNNRAADLFKSMALSFKDFVGHPIDGVTFCNNDFSKSTKPKFNECPGYLVDRGILDKRLADAARSAGVDFREQHRVTQINPLERCVEVRLHEREPISGELLIVATGLSRGLPNQVGVQLPPHKSPTWSAYVETAKPKAKKKTGRGSARVTIVVEATPQSGFCMGIERPDRVSVVLNSKGEQQAIANRLIELCRMMAEHGHVSMDLSEQAAATPPVPTFPFSALDVDSHVGKHALVIGEARWLLAGSIGRASGRERV